MGSTFTYGSGDDVGEEEDRESPEKFTKVGTTDNDLGPSTDTESMLGVGRGKGGLQEPVEIESQGITGEEPCQVVERSRNINKDQKTTHR